MSSRRPLRKDVRLLCDQPGPEDGIDPRHLRPDGRRQPGRKTLQLCSQVCEALNGTLAACGDEALRELSAFGVRPCGGGRLLVTLRLAGLAGGPDPLTVQQAVGRAQGLLRSEVAAAIHRRKSPELVFQVLALCAEGE
jgi:ribosome-binding factor A